MKTCSGCKVAKGLEEFHLNSKSRDGRYHSCKLCNNEASKMRYRANRVKRLAQTKKWQTENAQRCKTRHAEYNKKHKERVNRKRRDEWDIKGREYYREYKRRPHVKKKQSDYNKKRRKTDPQFAIKTRLRARLRIVTRLQGARKSATCEKLLGCSFPEFQAYFSSLFSAGMTWERFLAAEIHIDHIKPCDSFDLTDPIQQQACFHYTNCQPMWAPDNIRKGNKMDWIPNPVNPDGEAAVKSINAAP